MARVEWLQTAVDELTNVWLNADSSKRRAVTAAARQIENALKFDPKDQGESRPGGRRILFCEPLAAVFEVDEKNELATIVSVWHFGRRRGGHGQ